MNCIINLSNLIINKRGIVMKKYFIGIDAGTSLVKSVLFDISGNEIYVSKQKTEVLSPKQDWSEQDMNSVYIATIKTLNDVMISSGVSQVDIIAVGLTAQGDGCWMIDKDGNPVRNAILWSDGRAGGIINQWQKDGICEKAYNICGSALFPGAQGAILRWLKDNEPENVKKIAYAFYCKDWLRYKLTGVIATDESDASLPFYDIVKKIYSDETLSYYGIEDMKKVLPEVIPSYEAVSYIKDDVAELTGLKKGTPFVTGPFDVVSTAIGVDAIHNGIGCSIIGTTCFNEVSMDTPDKTPLNVGMTIVHGVPGKWIRALGAMNGTPNLDWFIDQIAEAQKDAAKILGINLYKYFEDKVKNIPIGSNGVIYHPYISPGGERAPFVKPTAKAQFMGICLDNTKYDMLRAVYEGVAMEMLDCYKNMPGEISEIHLSGGGASSDFWCQMFSDATGKDIKIPEGSEFGAKGAIINASVATKLYSNFDEAIKNMVKFERHYKPDMIKHQKYEKLYNLYKEVYTNIWNVWDELSNTMKNLKQL